MNKKTVFISGASSGIGKACAEVFAKEGYNLILVARRLDRLESLAKELSDANNIQCQPYALDIQDSDAISKLFEELKEQPIDILINNAGLARGLSTIQEGDTANWDTMIDTNIKGLLYLTRAALPRMIEKNDGHIINIGSIAGHESYPKGNIYCATKAAVRSISKSLRMDLLGTALRVSEIDPGAVETEFSSVRFGDKERGKKSYEGYAPLQPSDVAEAALFCASRPHHVNISEIVLMPQAQASIRDLYKEDS